MQVSKLPELLPKLEKILECGVCLKPCNDPRNLRTCPHSFCLACVKRLIDRDESGQMGSFNCHTCGTKTQVPLEGAEAFPKAFLYEKVKDIMDRYAASVQSEQSEIRQDTKHSSATMLCADDGKCM